MPWLVHAIGIREVVCRIIGKCVVQTIKHNFEDAVEPFQLCVWGGQDAGCEAAFHVLNISSQNDSCGCYKCH